MQAKRIALIWSLRWALAMAPWLLVSIGVVAEPLSPAPPGDLAPRHVLALYDGARTPDPTYSAAHRFAEMPLNHLGFVLDYHDLNRGLPPPVLDQRYVGVLAWLEAPLADPAGFWDWAAAARSAALERIDLKFFVMGHVGGSITPENHDALTRYLARAGVSPEPDFRVFDITCEVVIRDPALVDFETRYMHGGEGLHPFHALADATSHLRLQRPSDQQPAYADLVVTGPHGAYVHSAAATAYDPLVEVAQWVLDPFALFGRLLSAAPAPIPDTSTLNGRRIYYSHVDGDGWNNVCEFDDCTETREISASVMRRELIEAYPDLPVSVGPVTGDLEAQFGGGEASIDETRKIFALPQVEAASHSYTHPFLWSFFEDYRRDEELALIGSGDPTPAARYRGALPSLVDDLSSAIARGAGADARVDRRYIASDVYAPRAYMSAPFDVDAEVAQSLARAQSLAPPGKPARLMLWSGDALPFEAALRVAREAGALNLNGGGSHMDALAPSHIWISSLGRAVGGERQIYASQSNENFFTNDWAGPYYGFLAVANSLEATENPRRLKPFNLYYHAFSAQKLASLNAMKTLLEKARATPLAPIAASEFVEIANSFYDVEIHALPDRRWALRNRGALQTMRFDDAAALTIDYARSHGVLGHARKPQAGEAVGETLYAALDPAVAVPVLAMTDREQANGADALFVLEESRWRVFELARQGCRMRFRARGYGAGDMTWRAPHSHPLLSKEARVRARRGGETLLDRSVAIGGDGRLSLRLDLDAMAPVTIEINACAENGR